MTELLDPVVLGCSPVKQGGLVGVPLHETWSTTDMVDLDSLRIKPCYNRWFKGYRLPSTIADDQLQELKESLVMSESARSFSMSRDMRLAGSYTNLVKAFLPGGMWFAHYVWAVTVNEKMGLFRRPRVQRLAIQGMLAIGNLVIALYMLNFCTADSEKAAIEDVCRTQEEAEGAVEYYTKVLRRNKVLREILGKEGEYYFQEDGELVPYFYEMSSLTSIAHRLKISQDKLEKLKKGEENSVVNKKTVEKSLKDNMLLFAPLSKTQELLNERDPK